MSLTIEQSQPFEAVLETGISGLVGTLAVRIDNGGTVVGPTTANIVEAGSTAVYTWSAPAAPGTVGQYKIIWSKDGTFDAETTAEEDLLIILAGTSPIPPPIPPPSGGGLGPGPCTAWTDADAVMACCGVETSSSVIFDDYITPASELLFELSGRRYAGLCSKTVIACTDECGDCGWQVLSRGYVVNPNWVFGGSDYWLWGCGCPERVKLSGYPVREITEVMIDGEVLTADNYRLDANRYVTRLDGGHWPSCQRLCVAGTEEDNTISYTYGMNPPVIGMNAAAQLACEMYKACDDGSSGDCALPAGVTKITRQGITIEKLAFTSWGYIGKNNRGFAPGWKTGLSMVDAFLNTYAKSGLQRRPTFWAPGKRQYAQEIV